MAEAGAFSVVIENTTEPLARAITDRFAPPTIGIGASVDCDGQILVVDDMIGLFTCSPSFIQSRCGPMPRWRSRLRRQFRLRCRRPCRPLSWAGACFRCGPAHWVSAMTQDVRARSLVCWVGSTESLRLACPRTVHPMPLAHRSVLSRPRRSTVGSHGR